MKWSDQILFTKIAIVDSVFSVNGSGPISISTSGSDNNRPMISGSNGTNDTSLHVFNDTSFHVFNIITNDLGSSGGSGANFPTGLRTPAATMPNTKSIVYYSGLGPNHSVAIPDLNPGADLAQVCVSNGTTASSLVYLFSVSNNGTLRGFGVGPFDNPDISQPPVSPFPFTKLAVTTSANSSSLYLYHMINSTTMVEDQYDTSTGFWISVYFDIATK